MYLSESVTNGEQEVFLRAARLELAAAYRGLDYLGLNEGINNHLSVMAPRADGNGEVMLVFPEGLHWREVRRPRCRLAWKLMYTHHLPNTDNTDIGKRVYSLVEQEADLNADHNHMVGDCK